MRYAEQEIFPVPQAIEIGNLSAFRINLVQYTQNMIKWKRVIERPDSVSV
jgi:hypothetical protein